MGKPPYNKIRLKLNNSPFYLLLFYWLFIYLSLAVIFAVFYALADQRAAGNALKHLNQPYWIEFLHFSFTTQATVGYGDLYPVSNLARFLAAVQAIIGVILNALILGLTTYKFIKRSPSIAIADKLV